ncbi:MAG: LPS-assembly protein LptD [Lysobacterales bacterium CG02_land_8_20_14_3_00_62_12]|nr:MAG: LPS-assembly protein LptD [Xanthomonadales bacterium CG02_land_8_20_14_3_00_62_12]
MNPTRSTDLIQPRPLLWRFLSHDSAWLGVRRGCWAARVARHRRLLAPIIVLALAAPSLAFAQAVCPVAVACPACAAPMFAAAADAVGVLSTPRELVDAYLDAENFAIVSENVYQAEGAVAFQRADQHLWTEKLQYDGNQGQVTIKVPLRFQDKDLLGTADHGYWREDGDSRFDRVKFQLRSGKGNGRADYVTLASDDVTHLYRASFTGCDPEHAAWSVHARQLTLNHDKGRGSARHATLHLGSVPVFYLPVLSFSIDGRRKSGLLPPSIGNSSNAGFELTLPVYLNLAPNYDATVRPRLLTERGLMLGGEFRYLDRDYSGETNFDYLPSDHGRSSSGSGSTSPDQRYWVDLKHRQRFGNHWWMNADLRDVSDDRYFEDFGNSLAAVSTSLLPSSLYMSGRGRAWSLSFGADRFLVTDPRFARAATPFNRLPRIVGSAATTNYSGPVLGADAEFVSFSKGDFSDGARLDVTPWATWPLAGASWFLRPRLAYRSTSYQLNRSGNQNPQRQLPIVSLDAGLLFDRPVGSRGWTQTLEPRLFALQVPYRNQDDLPVFDTQELTFSFAQLFRENNFSGADRQTDASQVTLALTSRVQDQGGRERLRASFGQVLYFSKPDVVLPGQPTRSSAGSAYVAELGVSLSDDWTLNVSQQWDPEIRQTTLGTFAAQYRFAGTGVVNAAYRYRFGELEQTDFSAAIPLNPRWKLVLRHNQSWRDHKLLEAFGGFEYDSCCYAVRLLGRRFVRNLEGNLSTGISLELELKGLANIGTNTSDFLQRAILGYH